MFSQSGAIQVVKKEIRLAEGQIKEAYDEAFRNERNCLLLLDRLVHSNIIPLLGSYTYGGRHNFLFFSYEIDLRAFLQSEHRFKDFSRDFTFFSVLRGLASAFCSIHKLHFEKEKHGLDIDVIGYHHDLRRANVLISQDTFILADFGLGKIKSRDASSQTQWEVGEGDYLASERIDESSAHQNVGRAFDVWAFGCLMIEVIVYMERGVKSLNQFREQRMSSTRFKNWEDSCFHDKDGSLKSIVFQWLDSLTDGLLHPGPVKMLVDVSRQALKRKLEDRSKIEDICIDLTQISLNAHFKAVRDIFHEYLENNITEGMAQISNKMKL